MGLGKIIRTAAWVAAVSALLAAPASAKDLVYKVEYQLNHGSWTANWDCQCNHDNVGGYHTLVVSDNHFTTDTEYFGMKIPKTGAPSKIDLKAASPKAAGKWVLSGSYWTNTNPDTPINCTGTLDVGSGAPTLTSDSGTDASTLVIDVEPGLTYFPTNVTGTNCETGSVNRNPYWAFYPYSNPSGGPKINLVPDMLTAHRITISVARLRNMKVHDVAGVGFHEGRARRIPPTDCQIGGSGTGGTCTDSLHWFGAISITRTG